MKVNEFQYPDGATHIKIERGDVTMIYNRVSAADVPADGVTFGVYEGGNFRTVVPVPVPVPVPVVPVEVPVAAEPAVAPAARGERPVVNFGGRKQFIADLILDGRFGGELLTVNEIADRVLERWPELDRAKTLNYIGAVPAAIKLACGVRYTPLLKREAV